MWVFYVVSTESLCFLSNYLVTLVREENLSFVVPFQICDCTYA